MLEVQAESVRKNDFFPSIYQLHQIGMNKNVLINLCCCAAFQDENFGRNGKFAAGHAPFV